MLLSFESMKGISSNYINYYTSIRKYIRYSLSKSLFMKINFRQMRRVYTFRKFVVKHPPLDVYRYFDPGDLARILILERTIPTLYRKTQTSSSAESRNIFSSWWRSAHACSTDISKIVTWDIEESPTTATSANCIWEPRYVDNRLAHKHLSSATT